MSNAAQGVLLRHVCWGASDRTGTHRHRYWENIDQLADINARDRDGDTVVHAAAAGPDVVVLRDVLHRGGDQNVRNRTGRTPLHDAAQLGRLDNVRVLLEAGAEVNAVDSRFGNTPLWYAAGAPHPSLDLVALLRANGADPTIVNRLGDSILGIMEQRLAASPNETFQAIVALLR